MLIYLQMLETPEEKSLFEQIYLEYCGLMFHVAYEILHNEQDAEDAVHQAFVKIAENIKKIDAPVCPKTHSYVVTIVEHQAIEGNYRDYNFSDLANYEFFSTSESVTKTLNYIRSELLKKFK